MEKYICVHGHFYQPPRENPWLESVELQDSAAPYHDWNERITAECYAPNATARILNREGQIEEIVSNYSRISFNFGPTLLAWMSDAMPNIHKAIVQADKISQKRFSGHGSAIAQVYNHMILPLANARDKHTQIIWGIRDFEHRFSRRPEGMWLSETAADTETLEVLAEHGIKFTILSPNQANRTRELGKRNWRDVNGGQIDPTRPYLFRLPSRRAITLFFYDAPVSRAIAFERLLVNGDALSGRLMSAFNDRRTWDQLVHIATDGESYGHHHRHGEMALAYALRQIEESNLARLTNYGEYLEKHPPAAEVQIHEKSAWSCAHGVGRWMDDCGCNSGGHPGWKQGWRSPLRQALDWLRDESGPLFESKAAQYLRDPWRARNDYISIILDRSPENRDRFLAEHVSRALTEDEKVVVFKLLELQRHAMLMYTSCGWFFDELSGIETVQVIQYAGRALQLSRDLFDKDLQPGFLERLEAARSNIPDHRDGRRIFEKFVQAAMIDWSHAVAHYAISSLFRQYEHTARVFSFTFEDLEKQLLTAGKTRLLLGKTTIVSEITQESDSFTYAVLYMGEHNLTGGVRKFPDNQAYETMKREVTTAYQAMDFPETIRVMDRHFERAGYSLRSLFKDEQRRIFNDILSSTREDIESRFRLITERYEPLVRFLQSAGAPSPPELETVFNLVLHEDICRAVGAEIIDFERLRTLLENGQQQNGKVLDAEISFAIKTRMERLMKELADNPAEIQRMQVLEKLAEIVIPVPLGLNLWRVQDMYWEMLQRVAPDFRRRGDEGDLDAVAWLTQFACLGERLGFAPNRSKVEVVQADAPVLEIA
jgi:alpha-amylase/alpha-mannosidase (GH57 family)